MNRPPLSLSKLIKHHEKKPYQGQTAVIVATVTDDERVLTIPKMTVAALRFTEAARARITAAGGQCLTLDQLVMQAPEGKYSRMHYITVEKTIGESQPTFTSNAAHTLFFCIQYANF